MARKKAPSVVPDTTVEENPPQAEDTYEKVYVPEEVSVPEISPTIKSDSILVDSSDRLSRFLESDLLKKIRKKHGDFILRSGSTLRGVQRHRIPTGIFPLDRALGGGYAVGAVTLIWGNKSCAKTTVVLRAIGCAQKMCANCYTGGPAGCACGKYREVIAAFIDVEGTLDIDWAARQGVDSDRLLVSVPEYAEQTLDIGEALIRSGECDVIAIDSIAFMTSIAEIQEETAKQLVAPQARAVGKGVRKFIAALNEQGLTQNRRPTIFLINQLRNKVGVLFGSPDTQSGGFAPQFAAVSEVKFSSSKYQMDTKTGKPMYVDMHFRVEKNKAAIPRMEGDFRLILQDSEVKKLGDISDEAYMVDEAENLGIVEHLENKWICLGEEFRSKSAIERQMMLDASFKEKIRMALMTILLSSH